MIELDHKNHSGYSKLIITPNINEVYHDEISVIRQYSRICKSVLGSDVSPASFNDPEFDHKGLLVSLCHALGDVTVVRKGSIDMISNGTELLINDKPGQPRRSGGQGDILSGAMGVFSGWIGHESIPLAAYAASCFVRECSRRAYAQHKVCVYLINHDDDIEGDDIS